MAPEFRYSTRITCCEEPVEFKSRQVYSGVLAVEIPVCAVWSGALCLVFRAVVESAAIRRGVAVFPVTIYGDFSISVKRLW